MSATPTRKAWEADEFWLEVVNVLSPTRRLRPDHYLDSLLPEDLQQLWLVLSSPGKLEEQCPKCPKRRGGKWDGEAPQPKTLSQIAEAMRQVTMLRNLERQAVIKTAALKRCGEMGLDAALTDAVCQVVGEEALAQAARNQVGNFSVSAAHVLLAREGGKLKAVAEKRKDRELELKNRSLDLELEKYRTSLKTKVDLAMDEFAQQLKGNPKLLEAYQRFRAEVNAAMAK